MSLLILMGWRLMLGVGLKSLSGSLSLNKILSLERTAFVLHLGLPSQLLDRVLLVRRELLQRFIVPLQINKIILCYLFRGVARPERSIVLHRLQIQFLLRFLLFLKILSLCSGLHNTLLWSLRNMVARDPYCGKELFLSFGFRDSTFTLSGISGIDQIRQPYVFRIYKEISQ